MIWTCVFIISLIGIFLSIIDIVRYIKYVDRGDNPNKEEVVEELTVRCSWNVIMIGLYSWITVISLILMLR